jgi:hypothetical protein
MFNGYPQITTTSGGRIAGGTTDRGCGSHASPAEIAEALTVEVRRQLGI